MIGLRSERKGWTLASALSVGLHGLAVALLLYRPAPLPQERAPSAPLQIDVTSLSANMMQLGVTAATDTSAATGMGVDQTGGENTVETPPPPAVLTSIIEPALPKIIQRGTAPASDNGTGVSAPIPAANSSAAGPSEGSADPRLTELFNRIRSNLLDACMLALPVLRGDGEVQLGVLSANDSQTSRLMAQLTDGLSAPVAEAATLIDQRQCPAVAFARNDASYPTFQLGLQLDATQIEPGGTLSGRVSGGAGYHISLLLIDNNGVVHDMGNYLTLSVGQVSFHVPIARDGPARDTHQLMLALATPNRPAALRRHAGELAEPFFAALAEEVGPSALVGVATIYVR